MNIRHTSRLAIAVAAVATFGACGGPGTTSTTPASVVSPEPATTVTTPHAPTPTDAAQPTTIASTTTPSAPVTTTPTAPVVTTPRPNVLVELPTVTLLTPGAIATSDVPEFSWSPVDGAVTYRLAVLGPARPLWSWTGYATHVTLGLVRTDRSPLAPALALEPGSTWSVAALDAEGTVLALSPRQHVSPRTDG